MTAINNIEAQKQYVYGAQPLSTAGAPSTPKATKSYELTKDSVNFKGNEEEGEDQGFFANHWGKLLIGLGLAGIGGYFIFRKSPKEATEAVKDVAEKAGEEVKEVAEKAGEEVKEVAQKAGNKVKDFIAKGKEKVSEVWSKIKEFFNSQKVEATTSKTNVNKTTKVARLARARARASARARAHTKQE